MRPRILGIIILLTTGIYAQIPVNQWKGIVPLRSTKADFEKLAVSPVRPEVNIYETDKEKIVIWLSDGTCIEDRRNIWNVPKQTILAMLVSPKGQMSISEFIKEYPQTYEKNPDPEFPGVYTYWNKDVSVKFQTKMLANGVEDIVFIAFAPTEFDKRLRCDQKATRPTPSGIRSTRTSSPDTTTATGGR